MKIGKLVRPSIRSLNAYHAQKIPCKVKLDANESPYGLTILNSVQTNRYPDPAANELRRLAARDIKVKPENILHGNGSDELISYLIATFGGPVLYPVPTFSMYGIISQSLGAKGVGIPLDDDFDLDLKMMLKAIREFRPKLIFLSSPNNPTGNSFSADKILKIIEASSLSTRHPSVVVVDEAYQQFSDKASFIPLLKKHKNLVVLRTLSKVGLAALRVGFLIADTEIISEVNKVRLPFNVNALSQRVAVNALKNKKRMDAQLKSIIDERKRLLNEMRKADGIHTFPSDANFILFKVENADKIYRDMLKKGVLIRNMNSAIPGCLRVTVGTPNENKIFLKTIKDVLKH